MRARSSERSTRSRRTRSAPTGAVWPVVNTRWMTARMESTRSGSSAADGTRYGMRAAAIFFLARVIRAAIVDSLTRKARATSAVDRPQISRSVSATCASGARAGWQQVQISRSRSSGIASDGSTGGSTSSSTSSGRARRSTASRRSRSRARRRATVVSHAPGLAGMPDDGQSFRALAYASCTHSWATSRSRVTRTVAASTKAHSRRCASATAAATAAGSAQLNTMIGRTSTPPNRAGTCLAMAMASSRSAASTR